MLLTNKGNFVYIYDPLPDGWFVLNAIYTHYPQSFRWIKDFIEHDDVLLDCR